MTENFKKSVIARHLETYSNTDLCDLSFGTSLAWEFATLYGSAPQFYSYSASDEESLKIYKYAHKEAYDSFKSYLAICEEYKEDSITIGEVIYTDDGMITLDNIIFSGEDICERIKKCLVKVESKHHFLFASVGQNGFTTRSFPIREVEDDILDNYNDDIPLDKFREFIEMDKSGIAIAHGCPGGGKSYFIRYLISQYPEKSFIWFDQSLLTQATSDAFVQFILSHKESILILEDCELLIKSREHAPNSILNTVLNIADGIIGDSLKIKFICTFNTDYESVDKALTRKGRMKIKYEFKKLKVDKVAKLFKKFNITDTPKEMPLCDIYNYEEENGANVGRSNRIGFGL